ncbi:MAG: NADH-quinone oxidoreductase subunit NuoH [Thermoplasmata archaeon]|jgi:NADH-quinone oxidoreductase subunit H|nr:NADH-quinone oxidoreductase subunit NuoH [Thermoplasmata archaeon]
MNLYEFCNGIIVWLVDLVNNLWYWLGDVLPGGLGGFFTDVGDFAASDGHLAVMTILLEVLVVLIVAIVNVLNFIWLDRKLSGRIFDFYGPYYVGYRIGGWLQNIADGMKLFVKEIITPKDADRLGFVLAPVIFVSSSFLILATIPLSPDFGVATNIAGDFVPAGALFAFAAFAIAPFSILLAGWSSNNKYTLIGGMRSAAQMMSYEIPLLLSVASVFLLAGDFGFVGVVEGQQDVWYAIPLFVGFIVFLVCMAAEVEVTPFDLPEAEAELVEGWTTEYCGMRFGFFMMTSYLRGYAGGALATALFLGGWNGPDLIPGEIWFLIKAYCVFVVIEWMRWSLPRVRVDQILNLGWKRLLPLAMVNLLIAAALKTMGWF